MKNDDLLEKSDDLRRGELPHIRRSIEALPTLLGTRCSGCGDAASFMVDVRTAPRALCHGCMRAWRGMTSIERRRASLDFSRRGRL
jgi:hypothetical protein